MEHLEDAFNFETMGQQIERLHQSDFAGRSFEIELFKQYVKQLRSKKERIIHVHGTGGMGKTSLLKQFHREAVHLGAAFISLNMGDCANHPQSFCNQLAAQIDQVHLASEPVTTEQCLQMVNHLAQKQQLVIALDQYEDAGQLDLWLREEWLPKLYAHILIVIAGRYPLSGAWKASASMQRFIVSLPLTELAFEETILYLNQNGITDEVQTDIIWLRSMGHPLTLSIYREIAEQGALIPKAGKESLWDDIVQLWFQETASDELRMLLFAASIPRTFHQELLRVMMQKEIPFALFDQLIRRSFVMHTSKGWHIHDLVRESLCSHFRERMPETFEQFCQSLVHHYRTKIMTAVSRQQNFTWELSEVLPLTNNPVMRAHFRFQQPTTHYWEIVTEHHIDEVFQYVNQRKSETKSMKVTCSDPETGELFRYAFSPEQSLQRLQSIHIENLLQLGGQFHLLRHTDGNVVGFTASLPVHQKTLAYLMRAPISSAYFRGLTKEQLQAYQVEPRDAYAAFLFTIDVVNLEQMELRSETVRWLMEYVISGIELITSPPPHEFYMKAYQSLGFEVVPGADHLDYDGVTPTSTYKLDTRNHQIINFLNRLLQAPAAAPAAAELPLEFTARERDVAELLMLGETNGKIASRLFISEAAVKKHVQSMLHKTGLQNRTQLANFILRTPSDKS